MNIDEIIQQPGMKERMLKQDIMKSIHVAIPGEIEAYYPETQTAIIQPVIRDWNCTENPPLLLDVPVFMWGGYTITPQKGDGCLVICADSCIDSWFQSGGVSTPVVARTHSLSDGFAFVGFRVTGGKNISDLLSVVTKEHDGLCPKLPDETGTAKFLRQDGTWSDPSASTGSVTAVEMNGTVHEPVDGTVDLGTVITDVSGKKNVQTAVPDPTASGTAISFIDTLSQNEQGVITATKKNVNFSGYKTTQTAKSSPTASGNDISFIDTVSQDTNGVITATKKTVRSASDSQSGVVTTDAQAFAGTKSFKSFPIMNNGAQNTGLTFRATPLSANNAVIQANNSATSDGKYGNPYISFYEYSPASGGASRTSYYERYDLPAVNTARTSNGFYSILTTKTTDYVQGTSYTEYIIGSGFVTSSTTSLHLAIQLPKRISRDIQSFSSVKLAIRGLSGYVDVFTSNTTERYGTSGYSFSADMRTPYSIEMYITKTSAMTNITNNTPVSVVGNITFKP